MPCILPKIVLLNVSRDSSNMFPRILSDFLQKFILDFFRITEGFLGVLLSRKSRYFPKHYFTNNCRDSPTTYFIHTPLDFSGDFIWYSKKVWIPLIIGNPFGFVVFFRVALLYARLLLQEVLRVIKDLISPETPSDYISFFFLN